MSDEQGIAGKRLLIEIVHPAHFHLFKNLAADWLKEGGQVHLTAREKDVTLKLLELAGLPYTVLSEQGRGIVGLGKELLSRGAAMARFARQFRPDVMIALTGVSICPVGRLLGIPTILVDEAEHAHLQRALSLPFATSIMTGSGYLKNLGRRQVRYRGIWVDAYIHPSRFQPSAERLRAAGIDPARPFVFLRLVSWDAAHDVGLRYDSRKAVIELVDRLAVDFDIYGSFEGAASPDLRKRVKPAPVHLVHDLMAHASLFVGEGATMAAEAALLGAPSIYCGPLRWGYLLHMRDEEQLLRICDTYAEATAIARELLADPAASRAQWQARARVHADDAEDVTARFRDEALRLAVLHRRD